MNDLPSASGYQSRLNDMLMDKTHHGENNQLYLGANYLFAISAKSVK